MSKIICLMGKSSSGKDTLYKMLKEDETLALKILVPYTTRPIRAKEVDGQEYFFVDEKKYLELRDNGMILEERAYETVHGLWRYFTVKSEELENTDNLYLYIGTLEAYLSLKKELGSDQIVPIYIECDDGDRLERALRRERKQSEPKYAEMCRRFLADAEDFSEEKLSAAGITKRFINDDLEACALQIKEYILGI